MASYAAIDLGATSGRVAVGTISNGKISFEIIHRFTNDPINDPENGLLWNWSKLQEEVIIGLKMAVRKYTLTSVAMASSRGAGLPKTICRERIRFPYFVSIRGLRRGAGKIENVTAE